MLARVKAGLSQRELADQVCARQATISNYEQGLTTPDALMLQALAKALGQELEYFKV